MCNGATGVGLTVAFSVDSVIGRIRSAQLAEWAGEMVDFTGLDVTSFACLKPGDVVQPGESVLETFFDASLTIPSMMLLQTMTITFPITTPTGVSNGTLVGSGCVRSLAWPNAALNEPMLKNLTFAYDGETGPTFTPEADA